MVSKIYVSNFNVGMIISLCIYFLHMINVFQFDIYTHESTSHVCTHESTSHVCIFPKWSCSGFFYTYFCIICVSLCLDMCVLKWNPFWHSQISVSIFRYLVCSIEWWFSEWFYKYIYEESLNDGKREISYNIKLDNLELVFSNYILFRCFIHRKGFSVVLICNLC